MIITTWTFLCDSDDCQSSDQIVGPTERLARDEAERRGWRRDRRYKREDVFSWIDLCPFHAEGETP